MQFILSTLSIYCISNIVIARHQSVVEDSGGSNMCTGGHCATLVRMSELDEGEGRRRDRGESGGSARGGHQYNHETASG